MPRSRAHDEGRPDNRVRQLAIHVAMHGCSATLLGVQNRRPYGHERLNMTPSMDRFQPPTAAEQQNNVEYFCHKCDEEIDEENADLMSDKQTCVECKKEEREE